MNYGQLQMDLLRRGNVGHVAMDRIKRWLNESYQEICTAADWPFLETSASGAATAPPTFADLRKVISVHDATNHQPLRPTTREWIIATYGDTASTTGVARFYWVESTIIRVYPVAGTVTTYYLKVPVDLAATSDTPVIPSRFHSLIVDGAIRRAYEDHDRFDLAQQIEASRQQRLAYMKSLLLTTAHMQDVDDNSQAAIAQPQAAQ